MSTIKEIRTADTWREGLRLTLRAKEKPSAGLTALGCGHPRFAASALREASAEALQAADLLAQVAAAVGDENPEPFDTEA